MRAAPSGTLTAELDHVEVDRAGAQVRVFLPGPMDDVPDTLAKLQLTGTEPPDSGEPAPAAPGRASPSS